MSTDTGGSESDIVQIYNNAFPLCLMFFFFLLISEYFFFKLRVVLKLVFFFFFWFLLFPELEKDFILYWMLGKLLHSLWQGYYNQLESEFFALFLKRTGFAILRFLFLGMCLICKICSKGLNVTQIGYKRRVRIVIFHDNWTIIHEPHVIISPLISFIFIF